MNIHRKNKKILISVISTITVAVMILTGTFAWSVIQQASTGGRNETLEYVVMLLDETHGGIYQNNNWTKNQVINKPVYASSKYGADGAVKREYDILAAKYTAEDPAVFSDTWVRIKLEETFIKNGTPTTEIVKQMNAGKLVSSFGGTDGYFELVNKDTNTVIKKIEDWTGEHGRFWILDEDGWMYWAQPVSAPTKTTPVADQETDHLIDEVKLTKQPSGTWEYKITATMDAMDVEMVGYESQGAWSDVTNSEKIHQLFGRTDADGAVYINMTNFPDRNFRTYLLTGVANGTGAYLSSYVTDKKLETSELNAITTMTLNNKQINTLKGIKHFLALTYLNVQKNNLSALDISNNVALIHLDVRENNISSLDVTKNTALTYLDAANNNLSALDISNNVALIHFNVYNNKLSNLDISENAVLNYLAVGNNALSSLDVSNNVALINLSVISNKLTSLLLGSKPVLNTLHLSDNRLSSLDISGIPKAKKETWDFIYSNQRHTNNDLKTLKTDPVNSDTQLLEWE